MHARPRPLTPLMPLEVTPPPTVLMAVSCVDTAATSACCAASWLCASD